MDEAREVNKMLILAGWWLFIAAIAILSVMERRYGW